MHCVSACSAIHRVSQMNFSKGTDAGFWDGHSSGCILVDRAWHNRLQNRAGQKDKVDDAEQIVISGESPKGVVQ